MRLVADTWEAPLSGDGLQDPSIKQMAEQIAQDPSFRQMTAAMQSSMGGMMPNAAADESTGRGAGGAPPVDPANYAEAMSGVLQNPQFMEMAEKLGQQIMQVLLYMISWGP